MEMVLFGYLVTLNVERFRRYAVQVQVNEGDPWSSQGSFDGAKRAIKEANRIGQRIATGNPEAEIMVRVIDWKTGQEVFFNQFYGKSEVVVTVVSFR